MTEADGTTVAWAYDNAYRLTGETMTNPSGVTTAAATYVYDPAGNRTSLTSGGTTTSYTYNNLDQLTGAATGTTTTTYTYDGRGNLTGTSSGNGGHATTAAYTYNAADRLSKATLSTGVSATYTSDADGRRVKQTVGSVVTKYLWDVQSADGDVVTETDGSGAVQASYVLAGSELLAQVRGSGSGGVASYTLPDGQGSVRALANAAGAITDTYRYDAYGNQASSTGATTNPYRYDGQRRDDGTGLYQLRARAYDPTTGRFLSRDTAGVALSGPSQLNRYAYVQDDPIDLRDPSGFGPFADFADSVATIVRTAVLILVELPVLLIENLEALGLAGGVGWLAGRLLYYYDLYQHNAGLILGGLQGLSGGPGGGGTGGGGTGGGGTGGGGGASGSGGGAADATVTFYRGTTYYDALRAEAEGFNASILEQRQSGRQFDPGLYTSRNRDVAIYFAYYNAGMHAGQGGAALMSITLKESKFEEMAAIYGVIDDRPVAGLPPWVPEPHVETLFPFASLPALDANDVVTVEQLPTP